MRWFRYLALGVFFLDLPVPIYWFVLHPFHAFWKGRIRAAFWTAGLGAWAIGGIFVGGFWRKLTAPGAPTIPTVCAGILLISADVILLRRAGRELGHRTLVGHSELTGKPEMISNGLYAYVRHPRYAGMIAAVVGACLLAGTRFAAITSGVWLALVMISILLEEREMRRRFGQAYADYCRRVPRFLPRRSTARRV